MLLISILVLIPRSVSAVVSWIPCPENAHELDTAQWPASPSPLTYNLHALLSVLSEKKYMGKFHDRLLSYRIRAEYNEIRRWELGRGITHPYPMHSLRNLYWFITENRLHCYPSTLSLAKVLSQVSEVDSEAWDPTAAVNPRANGGRNRVEGEVPEVPADLSENAIEELGTDFSFEIEPDTTFQYFTFGPAKHLSDLIHLHADELEQYIDDIKASGQEETSPTLVFDIGGQLKDWTNTYYQLEAFLGGVRAFRNSLWVLRDRQATPAEISRLSEGKGLGRPFKEQLVRCFDRLCNNKKPPVYTD